MSMFVCKDLGCAVNYCGLLKRSVAMEWEGTDNCEQEYKQFNDCMTTEQRRYRWSDAKSTSTLYDYTFARKKARMQEVKDWMYLTPTENMDMIDNRFEE